MSLWSNEFYNLQHEEPEDTKYHGVPGTARSQLLANPAYSASVTSGTDDDKQASYNEPTFADPSISTRRDLGSTRQVPFGWGPSHLSHIDPSAYTFGVDQTMSDVARPFSQASNLTYHSQSMNLSGQDSLERPHIQPCSICTFQTRMKAMKVSVQQDTAPPPPAPSGHLIAMGPIYHGRTATARFEYTYSYPVHSEVSKGVARTKALVAQLRSFASTWEKIMSGETDVTESFTQFYQSLEQEDDCYRRFLSAKICFDFDAYLHKLLKDVDNLKRVENSGYDIEQVPTQYSNHLIWHFRALAQRIAMVNEAFWRKPRDHVKLGDWMIVPQGQ